MNPHAENKKITFAGPIVLIGFGSIGSAMLPLLRKHIDHTYHSPITIICPDRTNIKVANTYSAQFIEKGITSTNYRQILSTLIGPEKPRGIVIQVANEVSSKSLLEYCALNNAHYIDTVVEPWPGLYTNLDLPKAERSNYFLREDLKSLKEGLRGGPTSISCCGANPGMVSWLVKRALLNLANDLGHNTKIPQSKTEWALLMRDLGVKGVQIAERDSQRPKVAKKPNEFINTWSVSGFIAEGLQPAELGWGTHEKQLPHDGHMHEHGSKAAIYLDRAGMNVKVRTWTPTHKEHSAYLITHNESISIAEYYTIANDQNEVVYRPTCYYAYHPTDSTVTSIEEMLSSTDKFAQAHRLLTIDDTIDGADELGVLLYGHQRGAYWYGSTLSVSETRKIAPHQNPTGLQVSSAILAGLFYMVDNPNCGLLETDEIDHDYCLSIQAPYLGCLKGYYSDWKNVGAGGIEWQFSDIEKCE